MPRFTTSDGLSLAWEEEGNGTPVLCLPGLTRNARDFDDLAAALAAGSPGRVRLIRLTFRGRGASDRDPTSANYNVAIEARDTVELLNHLALPRATIVGTSRGGLVAMVMAATVKDRLAGVLLNDVGPELAGRGEEGEREQIGRDDDETAVGVTGLADRREVVDGAGRRGPADAGEADPLDLRGRALEHRGRFIDLDPDPDEFGPVGKQ